MNKICNTMPRSAQCDRIRSQRTSKYKILIKQSPVKLFLTEGGPDLSSELKLWRKMAESEMLVWLISELCGLRVGLPEVEQFGINLEEQFNSSKLKNDK